MWFENSDGKLVNMYPLTGSSKKICADRSVKPSSSRDEKCLSEDKASPQYVFPWNAETKKTITGYVML